MTPPATPRAVTFDFGQTLAELDAEALNRRLLERGLDVPSASLERALPEAWQAYNRAIHAGHEGHPWHVLMQALLEGAGAPREHIEATVEWLWQEQPRYNLWRRPIPGMFELVRELFEAGVPLGIVSNSEGRLAELMEELGIRELFRVVADSGKFGVPKPKPEIFLYAAESLGVAPAEIVHVGDALAADVEGALRVGMRVIWFAGDSAQRERFGADVRLAFSAEDTRAALKSWLGGAYPQWAGAR